MPAARPGPVLLGSGGRGQALSWAADDRTVAFQLWRGSNIYIGLADTAAPAGSPQSGRLVVKFAGQAVDSAHGDVIFDGSTALITPDGTTIVCAASLARPGRRGDGFAEYSAPTGLLLRFFAPMPYPSTRLMQAEDVLWTNASGSRLIAVADVPAAKPGTSRLQIGVMQASRTARLTPLPGAQFASELFSYPAW